MMTRIIECADSAMLIVVPETSLTWRSDAHDKRRRNEDEPRDDTAPAEPEQLRAPSPA
ncbi:MAG: hypothetical protein AB7F91_11840 [Parvularculaceae bacterium]|nr:hypothetical protein [Parvularculaceae bacterium]